MMGEVEIGGHVRTRNAWNPPNPNSMYNFPSFVLGHPSVAVSTMSQSRARTHETQQTSVMHGPNWAFD